MIRYCRIIMGISLLLTAFGFDGATHHAFAKDPDRSWVCKIISVQGSVVVKRHGETGWQPVNLNDTLFAGDRIRVEANSRAGIVLSNDAVLRLDQNTTLVFTEIEKETTFIFKLLKGAANFFSRRPRSLGFLTPFVNGAVEGTEFYVQVDENQTRIELFEGRIRAVNPFGELQLAKGQGALAKAGSAPQRRILVQPRDSVQWALYYPPVLVLGPEDVPDELQESLTLFNQGRTAEAIDGLEQVEEAARDSRFYSYRAALLLHVGRVFQARDDIQRALALDPDNGEAPALEAIIAVVQNRKEEAMQAAQKAIQRTPSSAAAQIALSYAHQAAFNLPKALEAAQAATTAAPGNGTAWARLAELRLSTGELDQGIQAARKAVKLNPHAAHAHTILGFAFLTQIKTEMAKEAFEKAIDLDSAAPLPRLGLGLAIIREGDLEQGRSEIEIAAGLDPVNALIRSYLGKAYFDEKRRPLDETQLEIAKSLDPNDPTPWFYDAIRKQTMNRPAEALKDLQTSIKLNNNRAVFRSQFLLDQDLAARSASLGRLFSDLDFEELALRESYKSQNMDHTNFSAHRLLADTYSSRPRHDIARVSELLKAQLLQPINVLPVQPQLAETNLFIFSGAGPARPSFNEFNPLFNRNRLGIQANGVVGNNDTFGEEVVVSAVQDNVSLSVGQFYYETDGFRVNNDLKQEIYNAFAQISLTHKTSIQGEVRLRNAERGDPYLRFLPGDAGVDPTVRRPQDIGTGRFGFHHTISSSSDFIGSFIYTDAETQFNSPAVFPALEVEVLDDGYVGELQHLWRWQLLQLTTGGGYLNGNRKITYDWSSGSLNSEADLEHLYGYVYASITFPTNITWTLGLSANDFKGFVDRNQINPKFGVSWELFKNTTLRGAVYHVVEDTLIAKQKLEPTHVAGFNQFFEEVLDGGEAVDAWNYGIGIDQEFSSEISGGVEFIKRDLDLPFISDISSLTTDEVSWKEKTVRFYLYAIPFHWLAVNFGYQYESFERDPFFMADQDFSELDTHRFPLGVNLFLPQNFSVGAKATYVDQKGTFGSSSVSDEDSFLVFDGSLSYRLPNRRGLVSIEGKNLFDENFKFQDTDPARPTIFPEQQILAKLSMSF